MHIPELDRTPVIPSILDSSKVAITGLHNIAFKLALMLLAQLPLNPSCGRPTDSHGRSQATVCETQGLLLPHQAYVNDKRLQETAAHCIDTQHAETRQSNKSTPEPPPETTDLSPGDLIPTPPPPLAFITDTITLHSGIGINVTSCDCTVNSQALLLFACFLFSLLKTQMEGQCLRELTMVLFKVVAYSLLPPIQPSMSLLMLLSPPHPPLFSISLLYGISDMYASQWFEVIVIWVPFLSVTDPYDKSSQQFVKL